jgi:hypothetical protein
MSRRASLPGADELFRATRGGSAAAPSPTPAQGRPGAAPAADRGPSGLHAREDAPPRGDAGDRPAADRERHPVQRRRTKAADRRPTGRERHEEKITVYCSPDELMELERARLTLRGEFGIAVDRGRIVREAIAIVLEDIEAHGEDSTLVRRLTGR